MRAYFGVSIIFILNTLEFIAAEFGIESGREVWKCKNDTICIHVDNLCDGANDCKNGDDEEEGLCT